MRYMEDLNRATSSATIISTTARTFAARLLHLAALRPATGLLSTTNGSGILEENRTDSGW
jgi:hypothetical protein